MAINTNVTPITPDCTVKILKGVSLDTSYSDTYTFDNKNAQTSFFNGKVKYSFSNLGPVKIPKQIRIPKNADSLYDCNYIMFQNTNFGTKWFYAFITGINFINVNMCTVDFEIDVMQTWYFEMQIKQCYVEREHTNNDSIGNNIVEENLELGNLVSNGNIFRTGVFGGKNDWGIMVAANMSASMGNPSRQYWGGVFSGIDYIFFNSTQLNDLNTWLDNVNTEGKNDSIVAIYMCSSKFFKAQADVVEISGNFAKNLDNIDGYVPKNKKLFTYPYNFLAVTNFTGNCATYRYEFFTTSDVGYSVFGDCTPSASYVWVPKNYNGMDKDFNDCISLTGLPLCSWTSDSYLAWLAQNQSNLGLTNLASTGAVIGGLAGIIGGGLSGNIGLFDFGVKSTVAGVAGVAHNLAKISDSKAIPDHVKGNQVNNTMFASGYFDFGMIQMSVNKHYAKIIDEYFSMYGYATHRVKKPNITGRESWNYVKTIDAKIEGNICFDHLALIKSIFNNGITFWHGDYIGNYGRSNNIV